MTLKPHSLRTRLLVYLGAAIALVAAVQASVAYRTALGEADAVFDYHMQQTALSLRGGLPFEPDVDAPELPEHEEGNFDFVVQIWSADGQQHYRSARRADLPDRAVLGFSTVQARASTYRVYSLQTPRQVVQVAQDMEVRRKMARTLALRTVAPVAWLVPLLLLAAWWVVGSTLAPLQRLSGQLAQRRAAPTIWQQSVKGGCPTKFARWCTSSTGSSAACSRPSTRRSASLPTPRTNCARR